MVISSGEMNMKNNLISLLFVYLVVFFIIFSGTLSTIGSINKQNKPVCINNGTLSGYVTDINMSPIEGALIRVNFHESYEENYSDENGYYHVSNIPICYCYKNVSCSKEGYKTGYVHMPILENSTYNFVLESCGYSFVIDGDFGENGWYVNPVWIIFSFDLDVVESVYFRINADEWILYTEPYYFDELGEHDLEYYVVLIGGEISDIFGPYDFKIDYTLPVISNVEVEKIDWNTHKVTADVSDEVSGIERVEFYIDGVFQESIKEEPWEFLWSDTGRFTLQIMVYDYAGLQTNSSVIIKTIRTDLIQTVFSFPILLYQLFEKILRTIGGFIFPGFC